MSGTSDVVVVRDGERWPACDCLSQVDRPLAAEGVQLRLYRQGAAVSSVLNLVGARPGMPFVIPRFCPFCGVPYRCAGEEVLTDEERHLLALVEAESRDGVDVADVLRGLIRKGLVRSADRPLITQPDEAKRAA